LTSGVGKGVTVERQQHNSTNNMGRMQEWLVRVGKKERAMEWVLEKSKIPLYL
jgi:hypothetical protein